ncbi:FAD-dependent oxidoreductase [Flavobacterium sp. RSSB_23]|uniref:FAD-dependent oxidoreductase n=1 Tax=Flavobacterium sp. RSSB_23 TaxID=3447668 RepID=UPI003F2D6F64
MKKIKVLFYSLLLGGSLWGQNNTTLQADIVVYGGTSAAVVAAVKAAQLGQSVLVISPDQHLGGMSASGLGYTDAGKTQLIGGLSKMFYKKVYDYYQTENAWKWQKRSSFNAKGQGTPAIDEKSKTMWVFEPHVAEHIFDQWIADHKIKVYKNEWLDRNKKIDKKGTTIEAFYTLSGKKIEGKVFIDATYEGDLMAAAGISYHVGREANAVYFEKFNGVQKKLYQHDHNFKNFKINPYWVPGDTSSGLLPKISPDPVSKNGTGDHKMEAYCYRLCLTTVKENQIPIEKPEGYDPKDYEILGRLYQAGWKKTFKKFDAIPNFKTDVNNHGPFSHDNIGMNYDYPEASYERRKAIAKEHENYQKGLLYFTATDPRVPKKIRTAMLKWGYPKDEFLDNGGFPHQLYIREARRMVGAYVMTGNVVRGETQAENAIGMGSYNLDSHNVQRYVTKEGWIENEGDVGIEPPKPYKIAMGTVLPKANECSNLVVPVCVSSSHIAYGSIRMEPIFMILAESSAQIAALAIQNKSSVQEVPYATLQKALLEAGQVMEEPKK